MAPNRTSSPSSPLSTRPANAPKSSLSILALPPNDLAAALA